jgi:hypothetical protein
MKKTARQHFKNITFGENSSRLKLVRNFRDLVAVYFENSTLNMMNGTYTENHEASEARAEIIIIIKEIYELIRLAGIKTSAASTSSLAHGRKGQNIDLIMNIFNLGRNEIPPEAAMEYIEDAIDVYKSNRLPSFIRTLNPFFWIKFFLHSTAKKPAKRIRP